MPRLEQSTHWSNSRIRCAWSCSNELAFNRSCVFVPLSKLFPYMISACHSVDMTTEAIPPFRILNFATEGCRGVHSTYGKSCLLARSPPENQSGLGILRYNHSLNDRSVSCHSWPVGGSGEEDSRSVVTAVDLLVTTTARELSVCLLSRLTDSYTLSHCRLRKQGCPSWQFIVRAFFVAKRMEGAWNAWHELDVSSCRMRTVTLLARRQTIIWCERENDKEDKFTFSIDS